MSLRLLDRPTMNSDETELGRQPKGLAKATAGRRSFLCRMGVSPFLVAACGRDEGGSLLAVGKAMPVLDLPDLDGRSGRIGGGGLPLLINFWATWCRPCRAEMGGLDRLHRKFSNAGLSVIGVSIDTDANLVREFILQQGFVFPIFLDRAGEKTLGSLRIGAFPTTVLVRRDGAVADVVVGERNWDEGPARDGVLALL